MWRQTSSPLPASLPCHVVNESRYHYSNPFACKNQPMAAAETYAELIARMLALSRRAVANGEEPRLNSYRWMMPFTAGEAEAMLNVIDDVLGGAERQRPAGRAVFLMAMCQLLGSCVWLLVYKYHEPLERALTIRVLERVLAVFPLPGDPVACNWRRLTRVGAGTADASSELLSLLSEPRLGLGEWPAVKAQLEDVLLWLIAADDPHNSPYSMHELVWTILLHVPHRLLELVQTAPSFDTFTWVYHELASRGTPQMTRVKDRMVEALVEHAIANPHKPRPEWLEREMEEARAAHKLPWLGAVFAHTYSEDERSLYDARAALRDWEARAEMHASRGAPRGVAQAREAARYIAEEQIAPITRYAARHPWLQAVAVHEKEASDRDAHDTAAAIARAIARRRASARRRSVSDEDAVYADDSD